MANGRTPASIIDLNRFKGRRTSLYELVCPGKILIVVQFQIQVPEAEIVW